MLDYGILLVHGKDSEGIEGKLFSKPLDLSTPIAQGDGSPILGNSRDILCPVMMHEIRRARAKSAQIAVLRREVVWRAGELPSRSPSGPSLIRKVVWAKTGLGGPPSMCAQRLPRFDWGSRVALIPCQDWLAVPVGFNKCAAQNPIQTPRDLAFSKASPHCLGHTRPSRLPVWSSPEWPTQRDIHAPNQYLTCCPDSVHHLPSRMVITVVQNP